MVDWGKVNSKVGDVEVTLGAVAKSDGSTTNTKTGGWKSMKPVPDYDKCIGCGQCWAYCPDNAISKEDDKKFVPDLDYCKGCGICAAVCPVKCITKKKEEK